MRRLKEDRNEYTLEQLIALPAITVGQADDLKIDLPRSRVWVSRMTVEDGMPYDHQITLEKLIRGRWVTMHEYNGSLRTFLHRPTEI